MSIRDGLAVGAGNLVPLLGVLLFGWSLPEILLVYWIETAVVGGIGALKIRAAIDLGGAGSDAPAVARQRVKGPHVSVVEERLGPVERRGAGGWVYAVLWLAVYLLFWAILGTVVVQIVNGGFYKGASTTGFAGVPLESVIWGSLSLVIGHLFAYYREYIRGERYLTDSLLNLSRPPFARPMVLMGTIAVGGVGTAVIGAPVGFLVAMVLAKTAIEIWWARTTPVAVVTSAPSTTASPSDRS